MRKTLFMLLGSLLLFTGYAPMSKGKKESKHIATCYGNKTCYACKNCKYCAYCNSGGGSCGVYSSSTSLPIKGETQRNSPIKSLGNSSSLGSQCKGTTKKGQRCKRMVKGGGYCWQHS